MTQATTVGNTDNSQNGPDKNFLPQMAGSITWANGNDLSQAIVSKGYRALGIIDPGTITGATGWEVLVCNKIDGTYAPLDGVLFTAGTLKAFGTLGIAEWNYFKIRAVGAVTGAGVMQYNLS